MIKDKENLEHLALSRLQRALSYIPSGVSREIMEISRSVYCFAQRLSEIRLRSPGVSSIVVGGRLYPLSFRLSDADLHQILVAISNGALYTSRESVEEGYVSVGGGVRVGVVGVARYDGGKVVGVGDISSLVFRMPAVICDYGEELYHAWLGSGAGNMIVASPPMGGKTTALAALARHIGSGRDRRHVVLVDERCEFDVEAYVGCEVDILRGYKRERGVELALRTMSPEVLIADEIASEREAEAIMSVLGAGVTVITSVHAAGIDELYQRQCVAPLLASGMFSSFALLHNVSGSHTFDFYLGQRQ